jgi:hypothetical protein
MTGDLRGGLDMARCSGDTGIIQAITWLVFGGY